MSEGLYSEHERRRYLHKLNPALAQWFDIVLCHLVRFILLIQSIFCIYYLVSSTQEYAWLVLIVFLLVIVVDTLYVAIRRKGQEWYWLSGSTFAYSVVFVVTIWQLVYVKVNAEDTDCSANFTEFYKDQDHWTYVRTIFDNGN